MEETVSLAGTPWGLIPIGLTILCVFFTKRIVLSLLVGVVSAAFIASNFNLFNAVILMESTVTGIIFAPSETALLGVFSRWYLSILIFLVGLGMVTTFAVVTGSAQTFVNAISNRVTSRKGVQLVTVLTGMILMIDDYFNAMVNGGIAKSLGDRYKVSRAKSAYIVDSIAAPICIIAPISSWAVAIMGNISTTYETIGQGHRNPFVDFIAMVPYNFYVFSAIGMVLVTIFFDFNIFTMKNYEKAVETGRQDLSAGNVSEGLLIEGQSKKGTVADFWFPIVILTGVTLMTMFVTGFQGATEAEIVEDGLIYAVLGNWSLSMSLFLGGIAAILSAMYVGRKHVNLGEITQKQFNTTLWLGAKSMAMAIVILILSWTIGALIGYLEVGRLVASTLSQVGVYGGFLPLIMFVAAAFLAFSIGTSWGTFALVLPIAGAAAYEIDMTLLLPAMSAVLSGAVWGDHASPISDTTVLASAGTNCEVVAHFRSQLPYALIAAGIAMMGYTAFGLTRNIWVGYAGFGFGMGLMVVLALVNKSKAKTAVL